MDITYAVIYFLIISCQEKNVRCTEKVRNEYI